MKLSQYMGRHGIKDAGFGRLIGRSPATISRIRRGINKPDWETMDAILKITKGAVTAADFQGNSGGAK